MPLNVCTKQIVPPKDQQSPWRSAALEFPYLPFFSLLSQCPSPNPTQQLISANALWKKIRNGLIYHFTNITYHSGFWPLWTHVLLVSWLIGNSVFCSTCWILFIGNYSESHCLKLSALGVDFSAKNSSCWSLLHIARSSIRVPPFFQCGKHLLCQNHDYPQHRSWQDSICF